MDHITHAISSSMNELLNHHPGFSSVERWELSDDHYLTLIDSSSGRLIPCVPNTEDVRLINRMLRHTDYRAAHIDLGRVQIVNRY